VHTLLEIHILVPLLALAVPRSRWRSTAAFLAGQRHRDNGSRRPGEVGAVPDEARRHWHGKGLPLRGHSLRERAGLANAPGLWFLAAEAKAKGRLRPGTKTKRRAALALTASMERHSGGAHQRGRGRRLDRGTKRRRSPMQREISDECSAIM
jgi:hypothetical protein